MKKQFNLKFISVILTGVFLMVIVLSACVGTTTQKPTETTKAATAKITIIGSTSVQPVAQELADAYSAKMPNVKIDIQGVGSSAGIKAAKDGTGDVGTSSRDLKTEEKAWGLKETVIALDGIAVVVNPKNKVENLTKDQVTKIFNGTIKNWKEVGGVDKEILVISREAGSGTKGAFEEIVKLEKKEGEKTVSTLIANALIAEGNGAVKANVAAKEFGIGYLSLGVVDNTVKATKIDNVEATAANVKAKTYTIARPFLFLTKGEPNADTKAFIDYILGADGQKIVSNSYITVK